MQPRHFMPWIAGIIAAVVVALLVTAQTAIRIEESWNIVVASEVAQFARFALIVTSLHAAILGVPLFLFLRSFTSVGILWCAAGGFLTGAVPSAVLGLFALFGMQNASSGGKATVVNGIPTLAGWLEYLQSVGLIGLFGLAGGIVFWGVMRLSGPHLAAAGDERSLSSRFRKASWLIAAISIISVSAIFVLPRTVKDNTCHNLFRDGRHSIGPQIFAKLQLNPDDWQALTQMLTDFGAEHSLAFRRDEKIQQGVLMWRNLSLCSESGVTIKIAEQPWLDRTSVEERAKGIRFEVFEWKAGSPWPSLANDLLDKIATAWPDKTTFYGPNSKTISRAEALKGRPDFR
jgi:hypothetical protein